MMIELSSGAVAYLERTFRRERIAVRDSQGSKIGSKSGVNEESWL
jgi:hypothetical protein